MVSASQIRNELAFYLAGIISLDDFQDWVVLRTWNVSNSGSKAAEVLTFAIEESLSEYTSEHIPENELRKELDLILRADTRSVQISYSPQAIWSSKPNLSFTASRTSVLAVAAPV
jgi:hypothetical protein